LEKSASQKAPLQGYSLEVVDNSQMHLTNVYEKDLGSISVGQ
jgi:hypothetical protein